MIQPTFISRKYNLPLCLAATVLLVQLASLTNAQILPEAKETTRVSYGKASVVQYRVGVTVEANQGSYRNIFAMIAVPFECEEQKVRIVKSDISEEVKKVAYRTLQNGVRQMIVTIPLLRKGQTAEAMVTFEVSTKPILLPKKTDDLHVPKKLPRDLKPFLAKSPFIESKHRNIKKTVKLILKDMEEADDWHKTEAIYDYVQKEIKYKLGDDKSAVKTLREKEGDCYSMSALFVALSRSSGIPARMVWVDNHCYPEFLLEDEDKKLHWFPCQVAGSRAFGEMPGTRPILQKGDNFRIPECPKDRMRYASDWAKGIPVKGSQGRPRIRFVRETL